MSNEQKINKLKDLQRVRSLVIDQTPEILDFTVVDDKDGNESIYATPVKMIIINLHGGQYVKVSIAELSEINEEIYSFIGAPFYYHADIMDVITDFIQSGDYKIENEA